MDESDIRYNDALNRWAAAKLNGMDVEFDSISDVKVVLEHHEGFAYSSYTYESGYTDLSVEVTYWTPRKEHTLSVSYDVEDIGQLIRELILA